MTWSSQKLLSVLMQNEPIWRNWKRKILMKRWAKLQCFNLTFYICSKYKNENFPWTPFFISTISTWTEGNLCLKTCCWHVRKLTLHSLLIYSDLSFHCNTLVTTGITGQSDEPEIHIVFCRKKEMAFIFQKVTLLLLETNDCLIKITIYWRTEH